MGPDFAHAPSPTKLNSAWKLLHICAHRLRDKQKKYVQQWKDTSALTLSEGK